jgi:hypothetical protein
MAGVIRCMALAVALLAAGARGARAHPIHTTMTVMTVDAPANTVAISIRVFADDFAIAVARAAGRVPPRDSSATAGDIDAYVLARLSLDGVRLERCGITRTADAYLLCYRAPLPLNAAALRLTNRLLTELHEDQVNIVQVHAGVVRRTHLFTRASSPIAVFGR